MTKFLILVRFDLVYNWALERKVTPPYYHPSCPYLVLFLAWRWRILGIQRLARFIFLLQSLQMVSAQQFSLRCLKVAHELASTNSCRVFKMRQFNPNCRVSTSLVYSYDILEVSSDSNNWMCCLYLQYLTLIHYC